MRRLLLALALLAALATLPSAAADATVRVLGGFFEPASLDVRPGETVTFTNDDAMAHTVTSTWDQGATFDIILRGGESFTWTFADAGAWGVHCRPHSGMEMTVTAAEVQPEARAAKVPAPAPALALIFAAAVGAAMLRSRAR